MNDLDAMFVGIQRVLDFSAARSTAIARNLANSQTPNFRRWKVDFDALVQASLETDRPDRLKALQGVRPHLEKDMEAAVDANGNSVSLEEELALLHRNLLLHEFATQMAAGKVSSLKTAIAGRGA